MSSFGPVPGTDSARLPASPTNVPQIGDFGHAPGGTSIQEASGQFSKGGFGYSWEGLDGVFTLPTRFGEALSAAVVTSVDEIAKEMQEYAKQNAPWEDQSGAAREGLKTVVVRRPETDSYSIFLGYNVRYGIYLETHNGGQLAIVKPTVQHFAPILSARVRDRVRR